VSSLQIAEITSLSQEPQDDPTQPATIFLQ
jgi:hypothetical protein